MNDFDNMTEEQQIEFLKTAPKDELKKHLRNLSTLDIEILLSADDGMPQLNEVMNEIIEERKS